MSKVTLKVLDNRFTIHRYVPTQSIPSTVFGGTFYWLGKTDEELSIVCDSAIELIGGQRSTGWACFKVLGPIDFSATGVLAGITAVLASTGISIFALSTFDTDYILLQSAHLEKAKRALMEDGYRVEAS